MHFLTPTELKQLCEKYNLSPSKSFGQNYLITEAPIRKMVEAAEISKEDTIVEIGPGFGILTFALAEKAKKVFAFEIERTLSEYWEEKQKEFSNIEIVWGDALQKLSLTSHDLPGKFKVVANLPYQITSKILRFLLEMIPKPERIVIMVQKEVGERICSEPKEIAKEKNSKLHDMSLLSISVRYYGDPKIVAKVPAGSFWPAPKVDSVIVSIENIKNRPQAERFFALVRAGYASRRKLLSGNLSKGLKIDSEKVKKALQDAGISLTARAEELTVGNWESLLSKLEIF